MPSNVTSHTGKVVHAGKVFQVGKRTMVLPACVGMRAALIASYTTERPVTCLKCKAAK